MQLEKKMVECLRLNRTIMPPTLGKTRLTLNSYATLHRRQGIFVSIKIGSK